MKAIILVSLLAARMLPAAVPLPAWLHPLPANGPAESPTPAEVLLNEENVEIDNSGHAVSTRRYAVRLLGRQGLPFAIARVPYLAGTDKVRDFEAWIARPGGEVIKLNRDSIVDTAAIADDVYNEVRVRSAALPDDEAAPGTVFAWQAVVERKMFFLQDSFEFQQSLPVRAARYSVTLPASWRANGILLGRSPIEPTSSGRTSTWRMDNLPWIEAEPGMPPASSLVPRLGVTLLPPDSGGGFAPSFRSWQEVARWQATLADSVAAPDEAIRVKARELTAGAKVPLDKVRAIGAFVQGINYISVQIGVARGGGYKPHAATEVLRRRYGDCKDKATLMRSLLRAVDIESFAVAIHSGNPLYVRPEWPSPHQFNHMIVAVKLPDAEPVPAILKHPALGNLLIFDPTDPVVPVGELNEDQQASHALVIAPSGGTLIETPAAASGASMSRHAAIKILADGKMVAKFSETTAGASASSLRPYLKRSDGERTRMVERRFAHAFPGSAMKAITMSARGERAVETSLEVESFTVLRMVSAKTYLFDMGLVSVPSPLFAAAKRAHPILLDGVLVDDSFELDTGTGFEAATGLEPVSITSPYGSLSITWTRDGSKLRMDRRFVLKRAVVPAAEYDRLKRFTGEVRAMSSGHVAIVRK